MLCHPGCPEQPPAPAGNSSWQVPAKPAKVFATGARFPETNIFQLKDLALSDFRQDKIYKCPEGFAGCLWVVHDLSLRMSHDDTILRAIHPLSPINRLKKCLQHEGCVFQGQKAGAPCTFRKVRLRGKTDKQQQPRSPLTPLAGWNIKDPCSTSAAIQVSSSSSKS